MLNNYRKINDNSKNVIMNVLNTLIIKGGAILVGLFSTPAYMRYFDNNSILGVWFTILSVLTWVLSFDMGIGNGLRNRLVKTLVNNDYEGTKRYISSSYIFLFFVSLLIGIVILGAAFFINWNQFFNILENKLPPSELRTAVMLVLLSILSQFVLRLITSVLYALQKAFIPNLLILITNIILLIYLILCNYLNANNNIVHLAIMYLLAVNIPLIVTTIITFNGKLKYARPNKKYFDKSCAVDTLKVGGAFLIIQIEAMIINNTSIFLITSLIGSEKVVEYNVYFKIFSMVNTFFALLTVPIWSAVTKAIEEQNYRWVKRATRMLQFVGIAFSVGQFIVFPFLQWIFDIWLGDKSFQINIVFMSLFAFEQIIMVWASINAAISNGLNELKLQVFLMTIGSVAIFVFASILSKYIQGYASVLLAHCIALLPYCIGQSIWLEKYFKKKTSVEKLGDLIEHY